MSELVSHYKFVKSSKLITEEACREYEQILLKSVEIVSDWWNSFAPVKKANWEVQASETDGIMIKNSRGIYCDWILPAKLDDTFKFGWKSMGDPREEISEKISELIDKTNFLSLCIEDEKYYERDYKEDDEYDDDDYKDGFTPYSGYYQTGEGDTVWCMEGESPDYTACSSDGCGYCGRCSY